MQIDRAWSSRKYPPPLHLKNKKKTKKQSQSIGRELKTNAQRKANSEHEFWHPVAAVGCGPLIPARLDSHGLSIDGVRGQIGKSSRKPMWLTFELPFTYSKPP